jgi:ubiquinone/menaquinone biosynthesis C-methylase UbiE/protein-S-isoprenylcysteine O-methyltransferase Ste14
VRRVFAAVDGAAILLACALCLRRRAKGRRTVVAASALLLGWQAVEGGYLRRRYGARGLPAYPGGLAWNMAGLAVVLAVSAFERLLRLGGAVATTRWAGVALSAIGVGLRLWAFRAIGTDFLRPPGQSPRLLRSGPYRFARHPAGWGLLLVGAGTALAWNSVYGVWAALGLLLPSLVWVQRAEQRANQAAGILTSGPAPSQWAMDQPLTARLYEPAIHPLFLVLFTRWFGFEAIYQELRRLGGSARREPEAVLDLACGTAWFGRRILRDAVAPAVSTRVMAIDISASMLAEARRLATREGIDPARLELQRGDANDLRSVATASIDEVWLCGALHQATHPEVVLGEVARVLRPGGALFCQTFVESPSRWRRAAERGVARATSFNWFARDELLAMLRSAGLAVRAARASGSVLLLCAERTPDAAAPRRLLVVGGTGRTGRLIAADLAQRRPDYQIDVGTRRPRRSAELPAAVGRVRVDVRDRAEAVRTFSRYDLVVIAVGPFEAIGESVHRLCLEAGVDCLDVNDSLPAARRILALGPLAEASGRLVLTGMGLSPGLTTLLAREALAGAGAGPCRLRLRLFVGGNQAAGRSAIRAMLSSFARSVPEIRQATFKEVSSDDASGEAWYSFPSVPRRVRLFHYPTPEAWTFPIYLGARAAAIERMDYRVHFQGMPTAFVRLLRWTPLLRSGPATAVLSRAVAVVHELGRRRREAGAIVLAEAETPDGAVTAVAAAPSSYAATARFASAIAELALEGRLAVDRGVHPLESALSDVAELRDLLQARGIDLSPRSDRARSAAPSRHSAVSS